MSGGGQSGPDVITRRKDAMSVAESTVTAASGANMATHRNV